MDLLVHAQRVPIEAGCGRFQATHVTRVNATSGGTSRPRRGTNGSKRAVACEKTSLLEPPFLTTSSRTKLGSFGSSLSSRAATLWSFICHEERTTPRSIVFSGILVESYPEFRVAYTRLVVICTDNPLNLNEFRVFGRSMAFSG